MGDAVASGADREEDACITTSGELEELNVEAELDAASAELAIVESTGVDEELDEELDEAHEELDVELEALDVVKSVELEALGVVESVELDDDVVESAEV